MLVITPSIRLSISRHTACLSYLDDSYNVIPLQWATTYAHSRVIFALGPRVAEADLGLSPLQSLLGESAVVSGTWILQGS